MKRIPFVTPALLLLLLVSAVLSAAPAESAWEAADKVFGQTGKDLPGEVHRYGWPRSDLHVTVGGIPVEPGLALGAWAAFKKTGTGEEAVSMGDLVLLESEVEPVLDELVKGGFEILAIHNHLLGETPHVVYVHFHGHGAPAALAKTLKAALAKTKTPAPAPGKAAAKPTPEQERIFQKLQDALGQKGTMAGTILQVGVARAEAISDGGMEVPPSMGMNNPMNFQTVGTRIATTGDFVLIAEEVNPVLRELRAHGVEVTALHSHMLRDAPRLFFMHFWGVGTPEKIGEGLKAALSKIATK
jgi:Domain of Unknown Function (DUF1259)